VPRNARKARAGSPEKRQRSVSGQYQQNIPLLDLNTAIRRAFSGFTFIDSKTVL
jgi:hypothetical protein